MLKKIMRDGVEFVNYPQMSEQDWYNATQEVFVSLHATEKDLENHDVSDPQAFVKAFEHYGKLGTDLSGAISCMHDPNQTPFTTKLSADFHPKLEEVFTKFYQNEIIFEKVKSLSFPPSTPEEKWQKDTLRKFQLSGCGLSQNDKEALLQINTRLSDLSLQFQETLNKHGDATIMLSEEEIQNILPDEPQVLPVVKYKLDGGMYEKLMLSPNPSVRSRVFNAYKQHQEKTPTTPIIQEMVQLRRQKASVFGSPLFCSFPA